MKKDKWTKLNMNRLMNMMDNQHHAEVNILTSVSIEDPNS
jgi:hypothetical protein